MTTTEAHSDSELMLRVRAGDTARLGMLFERHHKKLFNFFLHSLGKRSVAEDLTQEVFIRMLKYRKTFREDSSFAPWMFRMAKNVRADHLRKHLRAPFADGEGAEHEQPDERPSPSDRAEASESVDLLRAALRRLPVEKRELLLMARFELLRQDEIASALGCRVGTVKVRIHRALKELSEIYLQLASEARV